MTAPFDLPQSPGVSGEAALFQYLRPVFAKNRRGLRSRLHRGRSDPYPIPFASPGCGGPASAAGLSSSRKRCRQDPTLPRPCSTWRRRPGEDEVSWFQPNFSCFEQMLKKLGFRQVSLAGHHAGVVKPGGGRYKRAVILTPGVKALAARSTFSWRAREDSNPAFGSGSQTLYPAELRARFHHSSAKRTAQDCRRRLLPTALLLRDTRGAMQEAVIVESLRTPLAKSFRGGR